MSHEDPTISEAFSDLELEQLKKTLSVFRASSDLQPDFEAIAKRYVPIEQANANDPPNFERSTVWKLARSACTRYAVAAALLLVGLATTIGYRFYWPDQQAWVVHPSQIDRRPNRVEVSQSVKTGTWSSHVAIARVGHLNIEENSQITLLGTSVGRHRIRLDQGAIRARVWAPPNWFTVQIGNSEIVDLGCEFELRAKMDSTGVPIGGELQVISGWVAQRFGDQEILVPEKHRLHFHASRSSTPVHIDSSAEWLEAIEELDHFLAAELCSDSNAVCDAVQVRIANLATTRDGFSLLSLLTRFPKLASGPLWGALREFYQLANDEHLRAKWRAGDVAVMELAWQQLPKQPKSWWLNWRDVFR